MRAIIRCEVICCLCGGVSVASRYYKNSGTIAKIKRATRDWIYNKEYDGNICPDCLKELNIKG